MTTETTSETKTENTVNQKQEPVKTTNGESVADVWYTDPIKAAKIIEEKTKEATLSVISAQQQKERQEKEFWDNFYQANPDLVGKDRAVKLVLAEKWNEWEKKPTNEAMEAIAKETRSFIQTVSTPRGTRTELSNGPAASLPSSGVPFAGTTQKVESTNFVTQIKKLHAQFKKTVKS